MVDSARRHGPFDGRYPVRRKLVAPIWDLQPERDDASTLEWSGFVARFFPNRGRHDFETLAAYQARRTAVDDSSAPSGKQVITFAGADSAAQPPSALLDWESEGGSVQRDVA